MASFKGFMDWVRGDVMDEEYEDDYAPANQQHPQSAQQQQPPVGNTAPQHEQPTMQQSAVRDDSFSFNTEKQNSKVVNMHSTTQLAVVLVKPDRFENAAEIADHLKDKRTVVLNLEQTNKEVARRLVDFLSGVAYANEGKIKRVANSTYIITPYNVDILGDLIDELESSGLYL